MTPADQDSPAVHHDETAQRFETVVDGYTSVLEYEVDGERIVFTHTFVPPELRGRGVAERLVRAGLGWARGQAKSVVPACSYVAKFIERHAEFRDLLAD
jgi:predicted GNAT family acetyltransferase